VIWPAAGPRAWPAFSSTRGCCDTLSCGNAGRSGGHMKFASLVFRVAAVWGLLRARPALLSCSDGGGIEARPPFPRIRRPTSAFLCVTLAWQLAFWVIGSDPERFRPLMIPSMIEKFGLRPRARRAVPPLGRVGASESAARAPARSRGWECSSSRRMSRRNRRHQRLEAVS